MLVHVRSDTLETIKRIQVGEVRTSGHSIPKQDRNRDYTNRLDCESTLWFECPKCRQWRYATKHHIYPMRWFTDRRNETIKLCRDCHDDLEDFIPVAPQPLHFYQEVILWFFGCEQSSY